jgi:hypothetical protein
VNKDGGDLSITKTIVRKQLKLKYKNKSKE